MILCNLHIYKCQTVNLRNNKYKMWLIKWSKNWRKYIFLHGNGPQARSQGPDSGGPLDFLSSYIFKTWNSFVITPYTITSTLNPALSQWSLGLSALSCESPSRYCVTFFCCDQYKRHWPWILCTLGEISIFWTMIPWVVCAGGKGAAGPSTKDSRGRTSYPVSGSSSTYCALQLSYEVHCRNAQHIII